MFRKIPHFRVVFAGALIMTFWLTPLAAGGQDLVAVSSITGGSSVFVFRAQRSVRRVAAAKPTRTQAQRMQSVTRIKKQYETIAQTTPKPGRANAMAPDK